MKSKIWTLSILGLTAAAVAWAPPAFANEITQSRDLSGFEAVKLAGSSDIVLKAGKSFSVKVTAEDDEIDEIITEVKGEILIIRRKNKKNGWIFRSSHGAKVHVTMPNLTAFSSNGSGDAVISGVNEDDFSLSSNGSGDVDLSGRCGKASISMSGSGDFESNGFDCDDVKIKSQGSGNVEAKDFHVDTVYIKSNGSGDVELSGTCGSVDVKMNGSGEFDGKKFKCKNAVARINGSGDISLFASGDISVESRASGDIDIYGGGRITHSKMSGSGDLTTH